MIEYFVGFLGTFIFLSVIIITNDPIAISIALASVLYFGGKRTNSHFNPAVNVLMYLNNKMSITQVIGQTIVQILGAIAAYLYYKTLKQLS